MQQKIAEGTLRRKGYRKLKSSLFDGKYKGIVFRKSFKNDNEEAYCIDITKWEYAAQESEPHYEGSVQLYVNDSSNVIDLIFHNGWILEAIEEYVKQIYDLIIGSCQEQKAVSL